MTDELERRWDDAVEQAWADFRRRLADRLAALEDDAALEVGLPESGADAGAAPLCRALAWGGDRLTLRVAPARDAEQRSRLVALGFTAPAEGEDARVDLERREVDRAAWIIVETVRRVHGVVHPVWLEPGDEEPPAAPGPAPYDARFPAPDDTGPWFPRDETEVRGAVTRVARDLLDDEPEWDADGDLPLHTDRCVLHVVVAGRVPRLLLTATLLLDVVDEQRALTEVNLLNRRHYGLTFLLLDGRVVVRRELGVTAFVPADVVVELRRLTGRLDTWVAELQARVGGRAVDEDETTPAPQRARAAGPAAGADEGQQERYRAAAAVMRELAAEDPTSLDPATLVRVFHADRGLLMLAIAHTRAREAHWRARAAEQTADGRSRSARVSRARARRHRDLRSRLRRALRITVRAPRPDVPEQLSLFPQEDATS